MSLEPFVRCTCIRDGKVKKPHPFPSRLTFDDPRLPLLTGDPTEEEWEAHDNGCRILARRRISVSEFLGNITRAQPCANCSGVYKTIRAQVSHPVEESRVRRKPYPGLDSVNSTPPCCAKSPPCSLPAIF